MSNEKIKCNESCQARLGTHCIWRADEMLIRLASDESYEMCPRLRAKLLQIARGKLKV